MYRITLWNRNSTNFGKNLFVLQNGTENFDINIEANALACMMTAVRNPAIQKATMDGPGGTLFWATKMTPADECDCDNEHTCPRCGRINENCDCGADFWDEYQKL